MNIQAVEHGLTLGVSTAPRSPGLHASEIYGSLYKELEPKRYGRVSDGPPLLLFEAGLALEEALETAVKNRIIKTEAAERCGEFRTSEGIAFSPDLLITNGVPLRVGEIKLTWQSSRDIEVSPDGVTVFPPKFDKYFCQLMFYCHALETRYGRLYIFFINGNYQSRTPQLLCWDIEFNQWELDENMQMLLGHARQKGML